MNPLFVGIDVSSKNNATCLTKPDGSKHSSFSVQNTLDSAKLMSEKIASALEIMRLGDVVIGLEATSIYGDRLVCALRETDDWVDAFVIADHLRFSRIGKEGCMDDYRHKALQTLTRARFDVVQNLTGEKQYFASHLFLKCSGIAQDKVISTSSAIIALMESFETADDLAYANPDELTVFINKSGNRYLRYYLLEAANSVRRRGSEFRRYYDLKFKEANHFQHKRALALTARKPIRLVYRLLMDNRLYIPPEGQANAHCSGEQALFQKILKGRAWVGVALFHYVLPFSLLIPTNFSSIAP